MVGDRESLLGAGPRRKGEGRLGPGHRGNGHRGPGHREWTGGEAVGQRPEWTAWLWAELCGVRWGPGSDSLWSVNVGSFLGPSLVQDLTFSALGRGR